MFGYRINGILLDIPSKTPILPSFFTMKSVYVVPTKSHWILSISNLSHEIPWLFLWIPISNHQVFHAEKKHVRPRSSCEISSLRSLVSAWKRKAPWSMGKSGQFPVKMFHCPRQSSNFSSWSLEIFGVFRCWGRILWSFLDMRIYLDWCPDVGCFQISSLHIFGYEAGGRSHRALHLCVSLLRAPLPRLPGGCWFCAVRKDGRHVDYWWIVVNNG